MAIRLRGSVACVTGGGRGIGRATAEALAARGAHVVVGDLDVGLAQSTARALGPRAIALPLDVAEPASFAAFVDAASQAGPIALLVNNAGVMRTGPFAQQDPAGQARELAINLGGVVTGMRLVLPGMLLRNHGHIVNIASMASKVTVPGAAVYTASKSAVASLSRAVRAELAGTNVTLSTLLPAVVRTELTAGLGTHGLPAMAPADVARAVVESCEHGRAEVALPGWLSPVGALEQLLPEAVLERVKRRLGAQGRLTPDTPEARAYQERASR